MKNLYIIASQRQWNVDLAERLSARTGHEFLLVHNHHELTKEKMAYLNPRYIFFPHWSHRISEEIWQKYEAIIFHMTDVPYGRGGSPLQNLILRGHETTMISALRCVDELDAGPVYLKRPLSLSGSAEEIFYRADQVIEKMIVDILEKQPLPEPQIGDVTVFKRRKPEDGHLIHAQSMFDAYNMIRMLDADGYPPAFIEFENLRFEFKNGLKKQDHVEATVIIRDVLRREKE